MELKVFKCQIDNDLDSELEVSAVALVGNPAILKNFLKFKDQELKFNLDEDKRIISGPAMLADFPIYRKDDQFGEYYVTFDKATIYAIVKKFFKKGFIQNFNLFHKEDQQVTDVTIFESFISDSERGISPMKGFEDAQDGSWFISATIENEEVWQRIKAEEFKGFSVEGIFQYVKMDVRLSETPKDTPEQALEKIRQILSETELTD